jgi:hypothetical protein
VTQPEVTQPEETEAAPRSDFATQRYEERQKLLDSVDWIYDEDRDWYYSVEEVANVEGSYKWIDENNIRTRGGARFEVVDHDDEFLRLKVWKPTLNKPTSEAASEPEVSAAEEVERASRETFWLEVDRLHLQEAQQGLPLQGQWRNNFDLADMDGDGNVDILFGPARKGRSAPNVFLGDGMGGWKRWSEMRFAPRPLDYGGAAAGDLNGDGILDAAFGIHLRGLMAFVSEGDGQFVTWDDGIEWDHPGSGGDATSFSSRRLEIVDWDGDGDFDIVALGEGPKGMRNRGGPGGAPSTLIDTSRGLVLYSNEGAGQWAAYRLDAGVDFGDHFALGDLDGDGRLDVALASRRGGSKEILRIRDAEGRLQPVVIEGLRTGLFLSSVALDDLDGDGRLDVLVGYRAAFGRQWQSGVDLFFGSPEGTWELAPLVAIDGRSDFTAIDTGDFDGDARRDIVLLTGHGTVEIYLGEGARSFSREVITESPVSTKGCTGWSVAAEDLDHDGRDDVVAAFAGEAAGVQGLEQLGVPGCVGGGSLRAWLSRSTPQ